MQMFIGAGWRDGMKNSGVMWDLKSLFWTIKISKKTIDLRT